MGHVFISYAREDRPKVLAIAAALEQHGVNIWMDERLLPGDHFDVAIEEALCAADKVIVAWSPSSYASRWVRAEAGEGLERRILVPVLIQPTPIPLEFRRVHTVDLITWDEGAESPAFRRLLQALSGTTNTADRPYRTAAAVPEKQKRGQQSNRTPLLADAGCREEELVGLAVQRNTAFYQHAWANMERKKTPLSWNWAAFFSAMIAAGVWPAYRKMWALAFTMLLLDFLIIAVKPAFGSHKLDLAVGSLVWLTFATLLGAYGNALYRWHIISMIGQTRRSGKVNDKLRVRGGTSLAGMAAFVMAHAGITAAHYYGLLL